MKFLKEFFLVVLFATVFLNTTYCQSITENEIEIHELGITVNSIEELKTIKWDNLFTIFDLQKSNTEIKVSLQLEDLNVVAIDNTKINISNITFAVNGDIREKDRLKGQLIGITNKLLSKYKDE